jgi:hypothetical protein
MLDEKEFWIELFAIVARRETTGHNESMHRVLIPETLLVQSRGSNAVVIENTRERWDPA